MSPVIVASVLSFLFLLLLLGAGAALFFGLRRVRESWRVGGLRRTLLDTAIPAWKQDLEDEFDALVRKKDDALRRTHGPRERAQIEGLVERAAADHHALEQTFEGAGREHAVQDPDAAKEDLGFRVRQTTGRLRAVGDTCTAIADSYEGESQAFAAHRDAVERRIGEVFTRLRGVSAQGFVRVDEDAPAAVRHLLNDADGLARAKDWSRANEVLAAAQQELNRIEHSAALIPERRDEVAEELGALRALAQTTRAEVRRAKHEHLAALGRSFAPDVHRRASLAVDEALIILDGIAARDPYSEAERLGSMDIQDFGAALDRLQSLRDQLNQARTLARAPEELFQEQRAARDRVAAEFSRLDEIRADMECCVCIPCVPADHKSEAQALARRRDDLQSRYDAADDRVPNWVLFHDELAGLRSDMKDLCSALHADNDSASRGAG